jgi:outer membrane receptor protein involved in Fe transport
MAKLLLPSRLGNVTLLICVYLSLSISCFAQLTIQGRVGASSGPLAYVTVRLLDSDSSFVTGAVTDSTGHFMLVNIKPGDYLINASMIGFGNFSLPTFPVTNDVVLPEIVLEEEVTALGEIVIRAKKMVVDQRMDRLVLNLQNNITSSGNSVLEVLEKSPGVMVNKQNNTIVMNGRSGVRIMINDKLVQAPPEVVLQMLEGMNAANIDRIELISVPPAKYDADGNAGIIHIVTKENEEVGTSGVVGVMAGARWAEAAGLNVNINHRNKKFGYFLDYAFTRNHNLHIMKMNRHSIHNNAHNMVSTRSHRENITTQQNINSGAEWKVSKHLLLNVLVTGYRRNWELDAHTVNLDELDQAPATRTAMNIRELNRWQSATGSLGLESALGEKSLLKLNVDYLYYNNDNPSSYSNEAVENDNGRTDESKIDLKKNTPINFWVGRLDYEYRASSAMAWEAGMKAVTSSLDNNVRVQQYVNDEWITDPVFTSYSTLNEKIAAAYFSLRYKDAMNTQLTAGLRYEYTSTAISTPEQQNLIDRKYGYFFPSLALNKGIGTDQDFQFSYARRITRPTYNDIAPYVFFWGPNTFAAGNTSLYPSIVNAVSVGYRLKQWNASLQYAHSRNEIVQIQPEIDEDNNYILRSQNLRFLNTLSLTNSFSVSIASWWEVQSNIITQYHRGGSFYVGNKTPIELYSVNLNVVNQIRLPKSFSFEISGMYQSRSLIGISQFRPLGSLNAGIQKDLHAHGVIRLAMDDILNTNNWIISTNLPHDSVNSDLEYHWHNQFVRVTYTRNIGNKKLRTVKQSAAAAEERGRVN